MYLPPVDTTKAFLQSIIEPFILNRGIKLYLKREDLIHPYISGNKWYKLKYNLEAASASGNSVLLSFGGAYSNHIYALAAAGRMYGFSTIGIIRGEQHLPLNPTLSFASDNGMLLSYISREEYRRKNNKEVINKLHEQFGNFYLIPEGGTNLLAAEGCSEIINSIDIEYDCICVPCGTGGTAAGLISGAINKKVLGFPVLKNASFLYLEIKKLLGKLTAGSWELCLDYHFGGYAKYTRGLINFMNSFEEKHSVLLDQVYTAKMLYGIYDLIEKDYFPEGSVIIALHTGGVQGRLKNLPYYNSSPSINPSSFL